MQKQNIKYIAMLFAMIMVFSSVGILFGNVQIGNSNVNYSPASNPSGTLELTIENNTGSYQLNLYSNGSMAFYSQITATTSIEYFNYSLGTDSTANDAQTGSNSYIIEDASIPSSYSPSQFLLWVDNQTPDTSNYQNVFSNPSGFSFQYSTSLNHNWLASDYGNFIQYINQYNYAYGSIASYTASLIFLQNEAGQSNTFTATAVGGTSPYSYQWYNDGIAVSGQTSNTYTASLSSVGQYSVICKITDSTGAVQWSTPTFVMVNPHTTVSLSGTQRANGNTADVGQSISFTGDFTYNPYGITKNGIFTGTTQFASGTTTATSGSYTFGSAGTYNIEFYADDTNGYNATNIISYTIYADPILSALWTSNSVSNNNNIKTTDINVPIYISANASLGSGGYSYSWSGTYVSSVNSNTLTYTPTAVSASGYTITLQITDSNSVSYTDTITIVVNPALSVVITITTTGT
jgi:hypothetical protein